MQSIGQMNQYLLPNRSKKIDEFRIRRTTKETSLQNSQKAFGKEIFIIIDKTEVFQSTRLYIILKTALLLRDTGSLEMVCFYKFDSYRQKYGS